MFQPRLADLFEAVIVTGSAAHSIKVLRNNGMVGLRQCKPMQWLVAVITGSGSHSQPNKSFHRFRIAPRRQHPNDDIGSGH